jgi:ABC-type phosphate transport system ATPase subunit
MFAEQPEKICPVFQKQEPVIKDIIDNINRSKELTEKAKFAEKLQKEVNTLLGCPDYSGKKTDCKNCHCIANLRKKTADLILKVKKLG